MFEHENVFRTYRPLKPKALVSAEGIEPSTYCFRISNQKQMVSTISRAFKWAQVGRFRRGCYLVIAENSIGIYRTFSEEKLIEATSKQRSHCVLNRKSAGASEEFVDTKNFGLGAKSVPWAHKTLRGGCIRRSNPNFGAIGLRGPPKRRGAGIGGEVLRPEESLRCAPVPAFQLFSTPGRPWPGLGEYGSGGSRQNNSAEFGAMIDGSIRSHGPNIRGEWNRSAVPRRDSARALGARSSLLPSPCLSS